MRVKGPPFQEALKFCLSDYPVISNEAGCRKDFSYASWSNRAHFFAGARSRLFLELLFIFVHPKLLSLLRSSTWCCPPVISSITMGHDEFFDLPFQGGG